MTKNSDIIKIIKEDILRTVIEEKKKIPLNLIKSKIKVSSSSISTALKELGEENLIIIKNGFIQLSKNGQIQSKIILEKHLVLENYFKRNLNEKKAHRKAHILEHYVSEEVIKNIKKLHTLKRKGVPLTKFKLNKEGLITNVDILTNGLFERIVSMGILPGERTQVVNRNSGRIVIRIGNKKFALSNKIAKNIKIIEYEKT